MKKLVVLLKAFFKYVVYIYLQVQMKICNLGAKLFLHSLMLQTTNANIFFRFV